MESDPLWYKDAIIYELHVRAFHDSAGDGVGDFRGLAEKLDYLKDLGATALWLLPFYPSPLRDDGYDISDYVGVHPSYGALGDFKHLLREAHRRGLRVITELVLNHTSDQHPWFQAARRAPAGSPRRNFYVWSETPQRYGDARIIFKDFEPSNWSWDPTAQAYYWHRFYSHQPDLNWDNPAVWRAMLRVLDFWFELGVDGLRLDAVPYLYEREGTSCENLPETHATLKALRRHVDRKFSNRVLIAEANQWPEDAASYFGAGDETHMAFHFPLMPRMFMALHMEDRFPIIDILRQTPCIPESCQWALFLRNHDELTLEMVTDEERDYMYRVYAHDPEARINLGIRRRLAPLLGSDRRRIELMMGLLLSLPGTPVLYYGDEIGMGDNIFLGDRNGVRTPMQWSADRNAGFSRANPQRLYLPVIIDPDFSYETVNVQAQQDNPHSLLWWTRRTIALRQRFKAFGRGSLDFLYPSNRKVLAFVRHWEREQVLVVANLSRHAQFVELDPAPLRDSVPIEVFGRSAFPPVSDRPYLLTLGPHSFYWLELRSLSEAVPASVTDEAELPRVRTHATWEELFDDGTPAGLEAILPRFLASRRWFAQRGPVKAAQITDAVPVIGETGTTYLCVVRVEYAEGDPESYVLPLACASGEGATLLRTERSPELIARLDGASGERILYCAWRDASFTRAVVEAVGRRRRFKGRFGELVGRPTSAYRGLHRSAEGAAPGAPSAGRGEGRVSFAQGLALKLFRRLEGGPNPDVEVGSFLAVKAGFRHVPPVAGRLEYRPARGESATLAVLKGFVANEGDAWHLFLDGVRRYLEQVMTERFRLAPVPLPAEPLLDLSTGEAPPSLAQELLGNTLESVRLLGQRIGELHVALSSDRDDPSFAPEPFTPFYQRSLYQSFRNLCQGAVDALRRKLPGLPAEARSDAETVAGLEGEILNLVRDVLESRIAALRTRVHGDLHLGQVLWTGRDFVIVDFQGDPSRSLSSRRLKRSPLQDVAGMIRSIHFAAARGLSRHVTQGGVPADQSASLEAWIQYWSQWVSSGFLRSYLRATDGVEFLPATRRELGGLLFVHLLEEAVREMGHEIERHPEGLRLSLLGIRRLVETRRGGKTSGTAGASAS
jgi:maltose alpha-D-glucosyltransferase/alpha-amylase